MVLLALLMISPDPDVPKPRTDLPWQIAVQADGGSRVFDLDLGHATLADAVNKFGGLEGLALFEPAHRPSVLEAYFGNVMLGPLKAKIVVALEADEASLAQLRASATERKGSPSGDWKYPLSDAPEAHMARRLRVIAYVPATSRLDRDFFRQRYGEPAAWLQETEQAVSWFYPRLGLSILIDDEAREVLEYVPPRDFVMPEGATLNPAANDRPG